jgi:hypothetical protein
MLTKKSLVISLFLFSLCLLFACQKEKEETIVNNPNTPVGIISPASIYAHLEGDFYTQRVGKNNYSSSVTHFTHREKAVKMCRLISGINL